MQSISGQCDCQLSQLCISLPRLVLLLLLLLLVLPDEPALALAVGLGAVVEVQPGEAQLGQAHASAMRQPGTRHERALCLPAVPNLFATLAAAAATC